MITDRKATVLKRKIKVSVKVKNIV